MFLFTETDFLESLIIGEDPAHYFPELIIEFLTANNRLRCITDKVIFLDLKYIFTQFKLRLLSVDLSVGKMNVINVQK